MKEGRWVKTCGGDGLCDKRERGMGHKVVELVVRIRDGCFQVPNRRFRTVLNVLNTTPEFPACGVAGGRGRPMMAQSRQAIQLYNGCIILIPYRRHSSQIVRLQG